MIKHTMNPFSLGIGKGYLYTIETGKAATFGKKYFS